MGNSEVTVSIKHYTRWWVWPTMRAIRAAMWVAEKLSRLISKHGSKITVE